MPPQPLQTTGNPSIPKSKLLAQGPRLKTLDSEEQGVAEKEKCKLFIC